MIEEIVAVIVTIRILILIIWSQNSNDCNDDHNDWAILLIITIIIGGYSNEKKNTIINIKDN